MKNTILLTLISLLISIASIAQTPIITLKNPSFEDLPRPGKEPIRWTNCGFSGESPPDILPERTFKVTRSAFDGKTYLGMVVRDNDSWERVGQKLSSSMVRDQCYQFSIYLCRSAIYESRSQITGKPANYVRPVMLRIWGGNDHCGKQEKLAESELVTQFEWEETLFTFRPTETHTHLLFEAFYEQPVLFPYNGNILLDHASAIVPIECDSIPMKVDTKTTLQKTNGIYQIASVLMDSELDQLINDIHTYLASDPLYQAEIYFIEEDTGAAKNITQLITERLGARGWGKEDFSIFKYEN